MRKIGTGFYLKKQPALAAALVLSMGVCGTAWATTVGSYSYTVDSQENTGKAELGSSLQSIGSDSADLTITGELASDTNDTLIGLRNNGAGDGTVLGSTISITATQNGSSNVHGIYADSNTYALTVGANSTIITLLVTGGTGAVIGVRNNASVITIGGANTKSEITASGSGAVYAINADTSSVTTLNGSVEIKAEGKGAAVEGVKAASGAQVTIGGASGASVEIAATAQEDSTGFAYAVNGDNATITIQGAKEDSGAVTISAETKGASAGNSYAVFGTNAAKISVSGASVEINAAGAGTGAVIGVRNKASAITIGGANTKSEITASGSGNVYAINADNSSVTEISGASVEIAATAQEGSTGFAYAVNGDNATITIQGAEEDSGAVTISAETKGASAGNSYAVFGTNEAEISVSGASVEINAAGAGTGAVIGVRNNASAITIGGDASASVAVTVTGEDSVTGNTYGVYGDSAGVTKLTGSEVAITSIGTEKASGNAYAVYSSAASKVELSGTQIELDAVNQGTGATVGLRNNEAAISVNGTESVTISADGSGAVTDVVYGVWGNGASSSSSNTEASSITITGGAVQVSALGSAASLGNVYSLYTDSGCSIDVSGAKINLTAESSGAGAVIGVRNAGSSVALGNAQETEQIVIYAKSTYNLETNVYGVHNSSAAASTSLGAQTLTIQVEGTSLGDACAVYGTSATEIELSGKAINLSAQGTRSDIVNGVRNIASTITVGGTETESIVISALTQDAGADDVYGVYGKEEGETTLTAGSIKIVAAGTLNSNVTAVHADAAAITVGTADTSVVTIYAAGGRENDALYAANSAALTIGDAETTQIVGDISALTSGKVSANFTGSDSYLVGAVYTDSVATTDNVYNTGIIKYNAASEADNKLSFTSGAAWYVTNNSTVSDLELSDGGMVVLTDNSTLREAVGLTAPTDADGKTLATAANAQAITIGKLSGSGGVFLIDVDWTANQGKKYATNTSDYIYILSTGLSEGESSIPQYVAFDLTTSDAEKMTAGSDKLYFSTVSDNGVDFSAYSEDMLTLSTASDLYDYVYAIAKDSGGVDDWYIYLVAEKDTPAKRPNENVKAVELRAEADYLLATDMDRLNKRLGEARYLDGEDKGLWARYQHSRNGLDGAVKNSGSRFQVGYDAASSKDENTGAARAHGLAVDYKRANTSFYGTSGHGETDMYSLMGYSTWFGAHGHYSDFTAKVGVIDSDYDAYMRGSVTGAKGDAIHGEYDRLYAQLGAEYGRRIELGAATEKAEDAAGNGWYFEPQGQIQYTYLNSKSYSTDAGVDVDLSASSSLIGRLGFRLGTGGAASTFYVKADILHEFLDGGHYALASNGSSYRGRCAVPGTWYDAGAGFSSKFGGGYFYADAEYSFGGDYANSWEFNAGLQFEFN